MREEDSSDRQHREKTRNKDLTKVEQETMSLNDDSVSRKYYREELTKRLCYEGIRTLDRISQERGNHRLIQS